MMIPGPPYDARAVANVLLDMAEQRKVACTQMLLYKLIYFSHGWYLSLFDQPLIRQDFEAWQRGPVVKVVRDEFRQYKDRPIKNRAHKLDIRTGQRQLVDPAILPEDAEFISHVFSSYYHYGAWNLSEMTHEPGSPWDKLWNSPEPIGRLALRIRNPDIKSHFDRLPDRLTIS